MKSEAGFVVERLKDAINGRDLEALVGCFAADVESVHPTHPARTFRGREQVRLNWTQILGGVPDLRAELLGSTGEGETTWSEWHWRGTRKDGAPFEMRGVTIQRVLGDTIASVRFYMEPVEQAGTDVTANIAEQVGR